MLKRSRLTAWTFAEFRLWSTGLREGREMARRFNKLVRTPKSALTVAASSPANVPRRP